MYERWSRVYFPEEDGLFPGMRGHRDLEKSSYEAGVLEGKRNGVQATWKSPDLHSEHTDS